MIKRFFYDINVMFIKSKKKETKMYAEIVLLIDRKWIKLLNNNNYIFLDYIRHLTLHKRRPHIYKII